MVPLHARFLIRYLVEIGSRTVELAREAEAAGRGRHDGSDQVVEVAVRRRRELERAEADVVERLVVEGEALVRVLDELVHRERAVVPATEVGLRRFLTPKRRRAYGSTTVSETLGDGMTE